jgi:hydroxymethylpyrimidine/phosphomethylpyrimidine kinase
MVNSKGDTLFDQSAIEAIKTQLLPLAKIITPNIKEAELLLGEPISSQADMYPAIQRLAEKYPCSIVLKAGFFKNDKVLTDLLWIANEQKIVSLSVPCVNTKNVNGTGCSFSSAIASYLAKGEDVEEAVRSAKNYIHNAIVSGADYAFGHGFGPVNHFWRQEKDRQSN